MKEQIPISMKRIMNIWIIGLFLLLNLGGCSSKKAEKNIVNFTRDDFKEQVILSNPELITLDDSTLNDPAAFYLMHDSIIIVQNQPHCDHLIELFSLDSRKIVTQFASKGNGPGEFNTCYCYVPNSNDSMFYLKDDGAYSYITVDLNSTLHSKKLVVKNRFQYNPELHYYVEICPIDDSHYIGYHMWYLNDSTYNNNVTALKKYTVNENIEESNTMEAAMSKYKYFVASVNDVHLFMNQTRNAFWMADAHKDKIEIYDESLNLVKTLIGPDNYNFKYSLPQSNSPIPFVGFEGDKSYKTYSSFTVTDKHVYILYQGINGVVDDTENLKPVEVFKFDWDGNLLCNYKLDRFVYTLSVDSKEEYLYCSTFKSPKDIREFVRYKL